MAYSAKAVANYFLDKDDDISQMKLHKLLYFAQGWHLAVREGPLFKEPIEAWQYGPVVPSIWYEFKDFGSRPITSKAQRFDAKRMVPFTPKIADADEATQRLLDRVWEEYGHLSAVELSQMTHEAETPWSRTRKENEGTLGPEIPRSQIQEYFAAQMQDA